MTKTIMIEFADPRLRACDHFADMMYAYHRVKGALKVRHGMDIDPPYKVNDRVFFTVNIENDDELANRCNISRKLGEVGRVLTKYEFYSRYKVGSRLMYYYDATDVEVDGHL